MRDVLGESPWSVQENILETLRRDRFVCVPSCYDSGKSWTAARAVLHHVATGADSIAITSAPTWRQVRQILWGEIRKAWRTDLPGSLMPDAPVWKVSPSNWAIGFSTNEPERFQGYHEGSVLVVLDEAAGVRQAIYDAVEGLTTSADVYVLLIGNPVEAAGPFYQAAISSRYTTIPISAFDTPNLVAGHVVNPKLVTKEWTEARAREWGPTSPLYQSKVLGEFPDAGDRTVVALSWFNAAAGRKSLHAVEDEPEAGLDIARFGTDFTAIVIRRGPHSLFRARANGLDGPDAAGWALEHMRKHGCRKVKGDSIGVGGPVLDIMRRSEGVEVLDVEASGSPRDDERFKNVRAEMWWGLRERYQDGRMIVTGDDIPILRSQVTALEYRFDATGRIVIESKEDAAKRGIPSPDYADAEALAFYDPPKGRKLRFRPSA